MERATAGPASRLAGRAPFAFKAEIHAVLAKCRLAVPMSDLFGLEGSANEAGGGPVAERIGAGGAVFGRVGSLRRIIDLLDFGHQQVQRYWLWSIGDVGTLLGIGMVVVIGLGVVGVLVLRRVNLPLMLAVMIVGIPILWGPLALDSVGVIRNQLYGRGMMSAAGNSGPRFMEFGALLLLLAIGQSWWRQRRISMSNPGRT